MQERRKTARQRVLKGGKIVHNGLNCVYDCKVRDMTGEGARLNVENSWVVPAHFGFMDTARPGVRRPACVVWREASEIGIRFEDAA